MSNSLVIFREHNHYFGLFPNDFEQHFSLNKTWISPSEHSPLIWKFEREQSPSEGVFVHLGAVFGYSPANFSQTGHIFMKKVSDQSSMGIFADNLLMKIPKIKTGDKNIDVEKIKNLPPEIPIKAFRFIKRYRRKNIFVIDPLMLFQACHIL
ncbi:MAG: hypothetical protein GY866_02340 [Proteobacteria bacterium]|nr:hypothetical protein [Pseudomonadota bacterium]